MDDIVIEKTQDVLQYNKEIKFGVCTVTKNKVLTLSKKHGFKTQASFMRMILGFYLKNKKNITLIEQQPLNAMTASILRNIGNHLKFTTKILSEMHINHSSLKDKKTLAAKINDTVDTINILVGDLENDRRGQKK
jgi:hypothetical protein